MQDKKRIVWCDNCKGELEFPFKTWPVICPHCKKAVLKICLKKPRDVRRTFQTDERQQGPL